MSSKGETLALVMPVRNCESRIRGSILPWRSLAQEIIIVDQFSADRTAEIAAELGCHVIQNEPPRGNFNINRKIGMEAATTDWILYLDSDERPTDELLDEIRDFLSTSVSKQEIAGVRIPNEFYFLGKPLRYGIYRKSGAEIRMMRKGRWDYPAEKGIHYGVSVVGEVVRFKNSYRHFNVNTLSEWFIKTNQYTEHDSVTDLAALRKQDQTPRTYGAFWDAFRFFVRHYFIKLGFLDGFRGLVAVFYFMLYHLTQKIKIWEKYEQQQMKEEVDYIKPIEIPFR